MRLAWPRVPGLILALIWMTARLALPLQPDCPHHAAASAAATALANATHHAAHTGGSHAPASDDSAPASSAECECAAHCCAASTIDLPECEQIHELPLAKLATAAPLAINDQMPDVGIDRRQPPSTAPPAALTA